MRVYVQCMFFAIYDKTWGSPGSLAGKESACNAGAPAQFLGWKDALEKG